MIRLGIVDYINMLPVVYGLEKNKVKFDGKIKPPKIWHKKTEQGSVFFMLKGLGNQKAS